MSWISLFTHLPPPSIPPSPPPSCHFSLPSLLIPTSPLHTHSHTHRCDWYSWQSHMYPGWPERFHHSIGAVDKVLQLWPQWKGGGHSTCDHVSIYWSVIGQIWKLSHDYIWKSDWFIKIHMTTQSSWVSLVNQIHSNHCHGNRFSPEHLTVVWLLNTIASCVHFLFDIARSVHDDCLWTQDCHCSTTLSEDNCIH